jgi:hypothetical protein
LEGIKEEDIGYVNILFLVRVLGLKKATDFAFSPDVRYVGVVSEDGCLRVIDALSEKYATITEFAYPLTTFRRLLDTYSSYFGYLTTVAWSPDGRFLLVSLLLQMHNVIPFTPVDWRPRRSDHNSLPVRTKSDCAVSRTLELCRQRSI